MSQSQSSSRSTGPNAGQGQGERDRGTPEETTFKKEKLNAKALDPRGVPVGSFTVDGPSLTGEARIQKGVALEEAVRQLAEEVEKEPLPAEHRDQVERFQNLLLQGGQGDAPEK